MARGIRNKCPLCGEHIEEGNQSYTTGFGYHHEMCPGTVTIPTLETWLLKQYPGANLDKLEIPARIVIQIAESYVKYLGLVKVIGG